MCDITLENNISNFYGRRFSCIAKLVILWNGCSVFTVSVLIAYIISNLLRLDLDAWINDPPESSEDEAPATFNYSIKEDDLGEFYSSKKEKQKELSAEERREVRRIFI